MDVKKDGDNSDGNVVHAGGDTDIYGMELEVHSYVNFTTAITTNTVKHAGRQSIKSTG